MCLRESKKYFLGYPFYALKEKHRCKPAGYVQGKTTIILMPEVHF